MPDGRATLLPQMIDARLRDIIQQLSLPHCTSVQGPTVRRIPECYDETNWDGACSFYPDPGGNFAREFERKKDALRFLFKLPEVADINGRNSVAA